MSSNSSVSIGLQSCLDTIVAHPTVVMNHPNTPNHYQTPSPENSSKNLNQGKSWNFLLALTNSSSSSNKNILTSSGSDQPLARRSSFSPVMSKRSLEMCTESLGSETGTCIDSIMDELSNPQSERPNFKNFKTLEVRTRVQKDKHAGGAIAVPPPLTSIHGRCCVHLLQVRREDGRLVISASGFPSCRGCFKSERENGRLRLSVIQKGDRNLQAEVNEAELDISEAAESMESSSWGERRREDIGGKLGLGEAWSGNIRCNGDDQYQKPNERLPSFPIYVAMS